MINLIFDPFVFACPAEGTDRDAFEEYVKNLLAWKDLAFSDWLRCYVSEDSAEILSLENLYPLWPHLQKVIQENGINSVQPRDVVTVVDQMLNQIQSIETKLGISDSLVGDEITHRPCDHIDPRCEKLRAAYSDLVMHICLLVRSRKLLEEHQYVASRDLSDHSQVVESAGCLDLIVYEDPKVPAEFNLKLNGKFTNVQSPDLFEKIIEPLDLWMTGSLAGACKAIQLTLERIATQCGVAGEVANWNLGGDFLAQARKHGFYTSRTKAKELLRSIGEAILGMNLSAVHALRSGAGPNEAQRTHGALKAWRRDVDYEYHLHYWQSTDNLILASVSVHNDFGIPYA